MPRSPTHVRVLVGLMGLSTLVAAAIVAAAWQALQ